MAALRGAPSALRFSKAFAMNITKDTAVTINYKITDKLGKLLDKGDVAYLHGGYDIIFAKVEAALDGKAVGDTLTVDLAVEDAFGARDESLTRTIPKGEFPPGVKVGGQLRGTDDQGQPQIYHVVKIKGPVVLLDGNQDRKSTRLNSSHLVISYAVFCLKKKKKSENTAYEINHQER